MKYQVKVNGKVVNAYDFEWNDDISLWQAIGEEGERLGLAVTEENRADWEDCDGDNIKDFLENALKAGFIEDYDIEESGEDDD
jgi:hypothetical protein|nr:MAG TPA: hypothetical protein [Caudoviricetes sp.]